MPGCDVLRCLLFIQFTTSLARAQGKYLTPNTIVVALPALAVFMIVVVMAVIPDGGLTEAPAKKKD